MANIPFLNNAYFAAKVGIGVLTPNESLEVSGSILLSSRLKLGTGDHYLQQVSGDIYSFTTGKNIMYAGSAEVFRVDEAKLATFKGNAYFNSGLITTVDSTGSFYIDVNANNDYGGRNFRVLNNGTTYFNIDADGDVGIGTTNPSAKLEIAGTGNQKLLINRTDGDNFFIDAQNGQIRMRGSDPIYMGVSGDLLAITNTNVGIGTTSPGTKLDVNGNNGTAIRISIPQSSPSLGDVLSSFETFSNDTSGGLSPSVRTSVRTITEDVYARNMGLSFGTSGADGENLERMRITSAGNVGIGTTSPSEKLVLKESGSNDAKISILKSDGTQKALIGYDNGNGGLINLYNEGGDRNVVVRGYGNSYFNGGNVGIGTTSPGNTLPTDSEAASKVLQLTGVSGSTGDTAVLLRSSDNSSGLDLWHNASTGDSYIDNRYNSNQGDTIFRVKTAGTPLEALRITGAANATFAGAVTIPQYLKHTNDADTYFGFSASNQVLFHVGGSDRLIITSNGNVGIGTTSPSSRLTVSGTNNTTSEITLINTSPSTDNDWSITPYYNDQSLRFRTNSAATTVMTLKDNGNVGIGTTSPLTRLHTKSGNSGVSSVDTGTSAIIESNTTNYLRFLSTDSSKAGLVWTTPGDNFAAYLRYGYSDQLLEIGTANSNDSISFSTGNASEKMRILSSGNVGIGTASPGSKLQVSGSGNESVEIKVSGGTTAGNTGSISLSRTDGAGSIIQGAAFLSGGVPIGGIAGGIVGSSNTSAPAFAIQTPNSTNGHIVFNPKGTEKMRITSAGNVGIGTTSPQSKLHLATTGSSTLTIQNTTNSGNAALNFRDEGDNDQFQIYYALGANRSYNLVNGNGLTIYSSQSSSEIARFGNASSGYTDSYFTGNVGIGTTSPSDKLSVAGNLSTFHSGHTTKALRVTMNSNDALLSLYSRTNQSSQQVLLRTNGNSYLNGGNVGIGTTSPDGVLHIKKDNATATFEIQGGLNSHTTAGAVNGEINFGANDASTTGGIGASIKNISEISNGAHNGLAFFTGLQSRTPYLQQMLYFTARGGLSFGTTNNSYGTSGQILKSNADAPPSWVNASTVIGGPYLPLTGGTLSGNLTITKSSAMMKVSEAGGGDIRIVAGGSTGYIGTYNNTSMQIMQNGSNAIFIDTSKNIGIGTTSPGSKLHVQGTSFFFDQAIFDDKVGIGTTSPVYKLDVNGGARAGGKVTYTKEAGSLNTTGYAVAGITALADGNGKSCGFTFTCFGGTGKYQKLVYSCYNSVGTWNAKKVIDEGTNDLDVVASANGSTITFTFKAKSSTQSFTPRVTVEAVGTSINSTYA